MPHLRFFACMLTAATSYALHISNAGDEMGLAQMDSKRQAYEEKWETLPPQNADCCYFLAKDNNRSLKSKQLDEDNGLAQCLDKGKDTRSFQPYKVGMSATQIVAFKCGANVQLSHGCTTTDWKREKETQGG